MLLSAISIAWLKKANNYKHRINVDLGKKFLMWIKYIETKLEEKTCISNRQPGDADASGPRRHTLVFIHVC